jgi:succinoglycan biosynthesis transport protein ExoP
VPPERQTDESDLSLIAQTIRRRIWVIVICLVVAIGGSVLLTLRQEKQYSATSAVLLRPSAAVEPQRTVETNLQLLALPAIAHNTATSFPGMSGEEVSSAISTSQQGESDIIRIKATTGDPGVAAELANKYAEEFIAFRERSSSENLANSKAEIVERATADNNPVSPQPVKNVVFGALIGLALGIGLALLLEQLDRRVKRKDELPEVTGLPLLATVPKRQSFDSEHLGSGSLTPAEAEIFLMLRANLRYFNVRKDIRSVLVTSAQPGEGKSLISLGLTLGAAMSGERSLLIEADLRDPSLGARFAWTPSPGLSGLLSEQSLELEQVVVPVQTSQVAQAGGGASFDLLPAGAIPPNPTELLASQRMKDLLERAGSVYDFVVIDTPPIMVVADAIPLVSAVRGVLMVSGLGVSTRTAATDLAEQLERLEAPTLGLVANFATHTGRSYDGYGYGRPPDLGLMKASPSPSAGEAETRPPAQ